MTNSEKYMQAFVTVFDVDAADLNETFTRESREDWDSLAHLSLVGELEDAFEIMLETDDILNLTSYTVGKEILKSKYDIDME